MFKFLRIFRCPNCIDHREFFSVGSKLGSTYCMEKVSGRLNATCNLNMMKSIHFLIPQCLNQPVVIRIGYQMV